MTLLCPFTDPTAARAAFVALDAGLHAATLCRVGAGSGVEFVRQAVAARTVQLMRWSRRVERVVSDLRTAPALLMPLRP